MRDPRGVASNFPAAAKFMDRRGVADPGPAQPEPRRLKPEHIVSCQIGKHEITGQRPVQGAINDEGDAATASPCKLKLTGRLSRLFGLCLISKYLIFRERPRGLVAEAGFSS
jgi:hypothetical protein